MYDLSIEQWVATKRIFKYLQGTNICGYNTHDMDQEWCFLKHIQTQIEVKTWIPRGP